MNTVAQMLAGREKGQFPASIATSLALESLAGIHPNIPNVTELPINDTKVILINIRTIIRNIYGAVSTEVQRELKPKPLLDSLLEDMSVIEGTINRLSEGMVTTVFYACSYGSLNRKYPHAIMRPTNTERQLHYVHLERDAIKALLSTPIHFDIRKYDCDITDRFEDTFIITHQCIDLLSKAQFTKLLLLETHTGAIKNNLQWNTKLTRSKDDLVRIPFCRFSLQVFGDNHHLFSPMDAKTRTAVIDMAEADKWTALSTKDRIIASIKKITDADLRTKLLMLV